MTSSSRLFGRRCVSVGTAAVTPSSSAAWCTHRRNVSDAHPPVGERRCRPGTGCELGFLRARPVSAPREARRGARTPSVAPLSRRGSVVQGDSASAGREPARWRTAVDSVGTARPRRTKRPQAGSTRRSASGPLIPGGRWCHEGAVRVPGNQDGPLRTGHVPWSPRSAGLRIARLIPCLVGGPGALGARKSYFSVKRAMAAAEFS